ANVVPTMAAIASVSILAGESAAAQAVVSDSDDSGTALTYSLDNAPEGMQVSESGAITWATQSGVHSGEYTADVVVTDSLGASASQQFKVVVDGAPVVESIDTITLKVGGKVQFAVAASDPEDGQLTYTALNNPDGFKGNARNGLKGKFIWSTKNAVAGEYTIDIEVADTAGVKSVVSVQVAINANVAPTIEAMDPVAVEAGGSVEVQVVANDVDDDNATLRYVLENAPEGMQVSADGLIQWSVGTEAETATHSVTVIVLDGENAMGKQVLEVTVDAKKAHTLLSASAVVGPFAPEAAAVIDENGQTITVAKAGGIRFYKLQSGDDTKLKITSIAMQDDNVVMGYGPAGD
ncbi:MAG: putative Ig domain-containing protein, partial [Pedosphaera sp.]|nr:putative Ig domain-containing protein [Pedosphaera sp.]